MQTPYIVTEFYISKGNYNVSNCQKYKGEKNIPNAKLQNVTETETEWSAQKNMPPFLCGFVAV